MTSFSILVLCNWFKYVSHTIISLRDQRNYWSTFKSSVKNFVAATEVLFFMMCVGVGGGGPDTRESVSILRPSYSGFTYTNLNFCTLVYKYAIL